MILFLQARILFVGPAVPTLVDGKVLILYGLDAPAELADLSVVHKIERGPTIEPPPIGAILRIGAVGSRITAMGDRAWRTVADIGHVVVSFNGAASAERPGELCADPVDPAALARAIGEGVAITVSDV